MNCSYCEDHLSDYLEHALGDEVRTAMEEHLRSCSACGELLEGVREVIQWGRNSQVHPAPEWLAARIVANTPQVIRVTWGDWLAVAWKTISEPRFATGLLTSVLVIGWMGGLAGLSPANAALIGRPAAIYSGVEGMVNRVYGSAIRNYYSPIVSEIECQIQSRIERLRENS